MFEATIDIGTNSVLLLVGEVQPDGSIRVAEDIANVTRLGEGLVRHGELSERATTRTLAVLAEYRDIAARYGITAPACIGTLALREAANASTFIRRARQELGLDIEVLSAEREATLTYHAAAHDFGPSIAVLDIGGGSTELICERRGPKGPTNGHHLISLPLGCVTLTESFLKRDPTTPDELHALRLSIRATLEQQVEPLHFARPNDLSLVATAGTATTIMAMHLKLASYRGDAVHGHRIRITEVRNLIDALMERTLAERRTMPGLIPERADVILAGSVLLHEAMSFLGYADVMISDRGVKWGLFYERFCTH